MIRPLIYVISLREDEPSKNTALKMVRLGLAKLLPKTRGFSAGLVLDPFSQNMLGKWLRDHAQRGILVVDCSWRKISPEKFAGYRGLHVKLPPLLPGNPINYGKLCMLSSIEAAAAALYLTGFHEEYNRLLGAFKWMNTFHELNKNLLRDYYESSSPEELSQVVLEYWRTIDPCLKPWDID